MPVLRHRDFLKYYPSFRAGPADSRSASGSGDGRRSRPCSIAFTVSDVKGAPVYDARIRVHIAYGFAGVRRLDLEAATNVDGKTQFKGLPEKVKGGTLIFRGSQGKRDGSAIYDPAKNCGGQQSSIVLTEN
jgi:hypothetical protein